MAASSASPAIARMSPPSSSTKRSRPNRRRPRDQLRHLLLPRPTALFAEARFHLSTDNAHGEFYLTDVAALPRRRSGRASGCGQGGESSTRFSGANTIAEMMHLDQAMRALPSAKRLMAQGVTIFRPDTCVIDAAVAVGPDTVIEPYVQLLGATTVGSDCRIRSYSVVRELLAWGMQRAACAMDAFWIAPEVADQGDPGPVRPICARRAASARVPTSATSSRPRRSRMGKGSKANHLNYLGDADHRQRASI